MLIENVSGVPEGLPGRISVYIAGLIEELDMKIGFRFSAETLGNQISQLPITGEPQTVG